MNTLGHTFVPNDTYISNSKHIALITGANGSGKSVYIKQVGLLVFLAHIGSFLPCYKAVIGITDKYNCLIMNPIYPYLLLPCL